MQQVVAGVVLGNEVGKLGLSKARILDYCLMIGLLSLIPPMCGINDLQNAIQTMLQQRCMEVLLERT